MNGEKFRPLRRAFCRKVERPALEGGVTLGLGRLLGDVADRLRALTGKTFPTWSV